MQIVCIIVNIYDFGCSQHAIHGMLGKGACSGLGRDAFCGDIHIYDVNRVFRHNNVFIANLVDL
jgi:hypothetical protein